MKRSLVASAVLTCLVTGSAVAADMPLKAAPHAVPMASDWTGFYIFGFGGYSWGRISPDDITINGNGDSNFHNPTPKGGVFGFGGGYNWQFGGWVGGVELDYGFSHEKETQTTTDRVLHSKIDALGSARLRVGYLIMPNVLAYGTAGAGWGRAELSISQTDCETGECSINSAVAKPNLFGWVAGGGIEFKLFDHLRLRGEYLHYDFGSTSYSFQVLSGDSFTTNFKTRNDVARGALIWNF
jgi:outer membrane immunogenic protein